MMVRYKNPPIPTGLLISDVVKYTKSRFDYVYVSVFALIVNWS